MKMKTLIVVAGLGLVGCAHTQAPTTQVAAADCSSLSQADRELASTEALQRVDRVEAYTKQDNRARATQQLSYTAGARLYVPAQQGWSAPYLQRVLSCHAASGTSGHANDPLAVDGVASVSVSERGSRYLITVAGQTREASRQIWSRAQALQSGSVEVQQLSENNANPAM